MPRQIIKQPDGKYAIFSTIVDGFIVTGASAKEIVQQYQEEAHLQAGANARGKIAEIDAGANPYGQFRYTWNEAKEYHNRTSSPADRIE